MDPDPLRLAAIVHSSTDAIASETVEGVIVSWNPAAERLYGYRVEEAVGRHVSMLVPDDRRKELNEILSRVRQGQSVEHLETVRVARDGSRFDVLLSAAPLLDHAGRVIGVSTTTHDMTGPRQSARDLQRLAAIVDSSTDAILSKTVEGIITSWNPAAERLYGYTEDEVIGQHISVLVPADRLDELRDILAKVAAGSPVDHLETIRIARDGSALRVTLAVRPLFDSEGIVIGASTVTHDMTEQTVTTQARKEAELRFAAAFRRSSFGMAIADLDATVTAVNPALCDLLSRSPDELIGRGWEQYGHPADDQLPITMLAELRSGSDSYSFDRRYFRPDSSIVWLRNNVNVIRDGDERPSFLMAQLQDITDRKQVEIEMQHRALHDELTGLPNRALLNDRLEQALAAVGRSGTSIGVAFVDLDDFKHVNDALGHSVGDHLLVEVAKRLASAIRPADTVARFGGDEFVIVCSDVTPDALVSLADRVGETVKAPFFAGGHQVSLRASLGLTVSRTDSTPQSLLSEADAAMYRAKGRGRGRAALFEDSLRHHAATMLDASQQLRAGIGRGEIVAHFQPVIDLNDNSAVGVEALARWRTPDGGLVAPSEFIPLAETCGLIVELGEQILTQAVDAVTGWSHGPLMSTPMWVSVNLSAHQLADDHLTTLVAEMLARGQMAAPLLHFEITESVVMEDIGQSTAVLEDLKALGVRLSIDDFGTGYSSLAYLQQLPVDILKIDRSFVSRLDRSDHASSTSIVAAILSLANALQMTCIAEGVETSAQRDTLTELGCSFGQGFLWSKPLPADETVAWATSRTPQRTN